MKIPKSQFASEQLDTPKTCFNRINLNKQIGGRNFIGCLIHYFMLSFIFVSVDSLQPMLLQQKFSIDKENQIENFKNLIVISFDILVKVLTAPIFGYLADRRGRAYINLYGIICIGVTMMLMPYSFNFETYVLLRCIYAQGAISIAVVPLLADYVHFQSRGTCAAILVFMSSLGAVSSAQINFSILSKVEGESKLYLQYGVISVLVLVIGISYSLVCLKKGNKYYISGQNKKKTTSELINICKSSFKSPQLVTGYIAAFLARSDSILLSLYLVLWTYSFDKSDYNKSSQTASMLSGITYSIIMLSCIIYGFIYENKNVNSEMARNKRKHLMYGMLVLAMAGASLMNFSHQIQSFVTYSSLSILGIGMSGLLTASLYLINQFSNNQNRGYITGIQTLFGVFGIILQTAIGALLYQFVSRSGPFAYFACICFVCLILSIFVYNKFGNTDKQSLLNSEHEQEFSNETYDQNDVTNQPK